MAREQRPFNPDALKPFAVPEIRCSIGSDTVGVWRYTSLVPVEEIHPDSSVRQIASPNDLFNLEGMLADHFGGFSAPTTVPGFRGFGARDPQQPERTGEVNKHGAFIVYAAARGASDRYFLALRRELEEALLEGVILIERQNITIL